MSYAGPVSRRKRAPDPVSGAVTTATLSDAASTAAASAARRKAFRPLPNYSTRRDRSSIFAAGVALGVALGAGAALLFAPRSGADARHAIARRGRRLKRQSRDTWDDLRFELRQLQRKSLRRREASSL
jgi:hypothetical protein